MRKAGKTVRELLDSRELPVVPGCYDAIGARAIELAGFPAAYMSGFCVAASMGRPDIGLVTMTEVVSRAKSIADSIDIPLVADADTGYGGILNVIETVRALEEAGVGAIQLEDQVTPKKCGALAGKDLVTIPDMQKKIAAACDARTDRDTVIIGRTDALAERGLDETLARVAAWEDAGADAIMVMDIADEAQMRSVAAACRKPAIMLPMSVLLQKLDRLLDSAFLKSIGYSMVIHPSILLLASLRTSKSLLADLKSSGTVKGSLGALATFAEINEVTKLSAVTSFAARFEAKA